MKWKIRQLDPTDASDETLRAIHDFLSVMRLERDPEDRRSLQSTIAHFRNFSLLSDEKAVLIYAWLGDVVIGEAFIVVGLDAENSHVLWGDVQVLATYRRLGLGSELFGKVIEVAEAAGRRLITGTTDSAIPAGAAFAERFGASVGLVEVTSELFVADVKRGLLNAWIQAAPRDEFQLLIWRGPCPEEFVEAFAALQELMNFAPSGDLELEYERVTAEDIRESEAYEAARGVERWTLVAQQLSSGDLAGFTEVDWYPDNAELLVQGDTVVDSRFAGQGLGKWLKASMLVLVQRDRPGVLRVRTEAAESNEAMLHINAALGFRHIRRRTEWQVLTSQVK